jgi:hypothetical protein
MEWKKLKFAAMAGMLELALLKAAAATVIGVNITLTTAGASTDAADTSSLSIALINTILTALVSQGNTIGTLIVLGILIGLITGIFGAIVGLFKGITSFAHVASSA